MMKIFISHFNKTIFALFVGLVLPSLAFASTPTDFCGSLDTAGMQRAEAVEARAVRHLSREAERQSGEYQRFFNIDAVRGEKRSAWDTAGDRIFTELEARARTKSEKAAVAVFKDEIKKAVEARRSAVDDATSAFRRGSDKMIRDRQYAVRSAIDAWKTKLATAHDVAKNDCVRGSVSVSTRGNYGSAIKSAKDEFSTTLTTIRTNDDALRTLIETRNAAIDAALAAYHQQVGDALLKLKQAFHGA